MKKAYTDQTYEIPWTAQNVTNNTVTLWLNFSDPFTISQYSEKDSLIVKFNQGAQVISNQDSVDKLLQDAISSSQ